MAGQLFELSRVFMNRGTFSLMGLGTAAAPLLGSRSGQAGGIAIPSNLEQALPSSLPGPAPCTELPQLPVPASDLVSQELFPGFRSQFLGHLDPGLVGT
jgi:hypothetical protein